MRLTLAFVGIGALVLCASFATVAATLGAGAKGNRFRFLRSKLKQRAEGLDLKIHDQGASFVSSKQLSPEEEDEAVAASLLEVRARTQARVRAHARTRRATVEEALDAFRHGLLSTHQEAAMRCCGFLHRDARPMASPSFSSSQQLPMNPYSPFDEMWDPTAFLEVTDDCTRDAVKSVVAAGVRAHKDVNAIIQDFSGHANCSMIQSVGRWSAVITNAFATSWSSYESDYVTPGINPLDQQAVGGYKQWDENRKKLSAIYTAIDSAFNKHDIHGKQDKLKTAIFGETAPIAHGPARTCLLAASTTYGHSNRLFDLIVLSGMETDKTARQNFAATTNICSNICNMDTNGNNKRCGYTARGLFQLFSFNRELNASMISTPSKTNVSNAWKAIRPSRGWTKSKHKVWLVEASNGQGDGHAFMIERTYNAANQSIYDIYTAWVGYHTLYQMLSDNDAAVVSRTLTKAQMETLWGKVKNEEANWQEIFVTKDAIWETGVSSPMRQSDELLVFKKLYLQYEYSRGCGAAWDPTINYIKNLGRHWLYQCTQLGACPMADRHGVGGGDSANPYDASREMHWEAAVPEDAGDEGGD